MNYAMTTTTAGDETICEGPCLVTGRTHRVTVRTEDLLAWRAGKLAQMAFPYLSGRDREFLISGTSPAGWEHLFGRGDESEKS